MLSLYTKTNKMLVQATDIDKQMWEVLCGWFFYYYYLFWQHSFFPEYKTKPRCHLIFWKWQSLKSNDFKLHYTQTVAPKREGWAGDGGHNLRLFVG